MSDRDPTAGAARVAVVTGVSRRDGIGFAIARRLLADRFRLLVHSWAPGDDDQGVRDPGGVEAVLAELGDVAHVDADLADPGAPAAVIDAAVAAYGGVDALVVNHAVSSADTLATTTPALLDRVWAANARGAVLLAQAFARARDDARGDGRIVLFTSGQHRGPMPGELAYVVSKGAIHQMTATLADELGPRGITVNAINPGPVDTGWPSPELRERLAPAFPAGRWGRPDDIAKVVAWLCSPESAWVTGTVIDAEGGFRRG